MMQTETFFDLFLTELKELPELYHYYKFHDDPGKLEFRKSYFIQRLNYIEHQVRQQIASGIKHPKIWDCGCGYGTTCLFLAMNGISSYGTTLEFYWPFIEQRKKYWSAYGNSELFQAGYENVMDQSPEKDSIDIIILQDTLHHLEPIDQALNTFRQVLRHHGILIGVEENGSNIVQNLKLYKQRGNRRIITFWDETLQKEITMGNENIRSIEKWTELLLKHQLKIIPESTEFIRIFPPAMYKERNAAQMARRESQIQSTFLKKYFFFGINFIARKMDV